MLLKCPICGLVDFFVERHDAGRGALFFSVNETGTLLNVRPESGQSAISADTVIFCVGCAWNGTRADLMNEQD